MYLSHLIVLLNFVFDYSNNNYHFSVDKVTTGTYNLVSVILKVAFVAGFIACLAGLPPCTRTVECVLYQ